MIFTCINCPMGCQLSVSEENGVIKVTGNTCMRGSEYAKQEYTRPKRMLTTLLALSCGGVVPVKSSESIDKDRLFDVLHHLKTVIVNPPIRIGDVLVKDCLGLNVDIVATKNITL